MAILWDAPKRKRTYKKRTDNPLNDFSISLTKVGAACLETEWLGSQTLHRVCCAAGHQCKIRPGDIQQGRGLVCRACVGKDPATAERNFRQRIAELGGECLFDTWLGTMKPHKVRCANGHTSSPTPHNVPEQLVTVPLNNVRGIPLYRIGAIAA